MPGAESEIRESLRGVHVLLVDGEGEWLELITQILEYCGALVTPCTSARHALTVMQRVKPNVLVVGIQTPAENAYWLIRSVRALPPEHGGAVPAVALTSLGNDVTPELVLSRGFQVYLDKPVHVSELSAAIAAVVKLQSSESSAVR